MQKHVYILTFVLALLALVSALSTPGIFLWPLKALRIQDYFATQPFLLGFMAVLRILFLVLPLVALVSALLKRRWSLYCTIAFAVVAWVFGAASIPFLAFAFPSVAPRSIAITIINLCVVGLAVWLWLRWGAANNSFQRTRYARR